MLELTQIPEKFTVIGGGVIGLEMAAYYAAVGSKALWWKCWIILPALKVDNMVVFMCLPLSYNFTQKNQAGGIFCLKNHQPGASDKKYPPLVIVTVVCQPLKHN